MNTDTQIPELSFKSIEEGDSDSIRLLDSALENHGFFSITDHGLSEPILDQCYNCLLYTSPSPRDKRQSRMPSSA